MFFGSLIVVFERKTWWAIRPVWSLSIERWRLRSGNANGDSTLVSIFFVFECLAYFRGIRDGPFVRGTPLRGHPFCVVPERIQVDDVVGYLSFFSVLFLFLFLVSFRPQSVVVVDCFPNSRKKAGRVFILSLFIIVPQVLPDAR